MEPTNNGIVTTLPDRSSTLISLQQHVHTADLAQTSLPQHTTIGDTPVYTVGDLLQELHRQYTQLPEDEFLSVFLQGADHIAELSRDQMQPWVQLMIAYEQFGEHLAAFQRFKGTDEYHEQFAPFKRVRDYAAASQHQVDTAHAQVPARYTHFGRKLLAHYSGINWARTLKSLTNLHPSETRGIGALNRAILNRLDRVATSTYRGRGRSATVQVTTADLHQALKLPADFSIPTDAEITARGLYVDHNLGTVTSIPPDQQSYAVTEFGGSAASTPNPNRFTSINSPARIAAPSSPSNARSTSVSAAKISPELQTDQHHLDAQSDRFYHTAAVEDASGSQAGHDPGHVQSPQPTTPTVHCNEASPDEHETQKEPTTPDADLQPALQDVNGSQSLDLRTSSSPEHEVVPTSLAEGVTDNEILELLGEDTTVQQSEPEPETDSEALCACVLHEVLERKEIPVLEKMAQQSFRTQPVQNREVVLQFLHAREAQLAKTASEDLESMCNNHLDLLRRALGLKLEGKQQLAQRLATLATHANSLVDFEAFTQYDAERSSWFLRPIFRLNRFAHFHFRHSKVELRMPTRPEEWDLLVKDITRQIPQLTTDPRSMLAVHGFVDIEMHNPYLQEPALQEAIAMETQVLNHHTCTTGTVRWPRQYSVVQQTWAQDLGRYLLDVCLRPDHPHRLTAFPQPVIETPSQSADDPPEPFYIPIALARPDQFRNSLTSLVPLVPENESSCDHLLMGVGGTPEALQDFRDHYIDYVSSQGGSLSSRFSHHIDAPGLAATMPEQYTVKPSPIPSTSHVRFLAPWMPRAHRGTQARLVIQPTLVHERPSCATDPHYNPRRQGHPKDLRTESGAFLADLRLRNMEFRASRYGPWQDAHPLRAIRPWPAWQVVRGVSAIADAIIGYRQWDEPEVITQLNILFDPDPANAPKRWRLVDDHCRAAAAAALAAIHNFLDQETELFPTNGFRSGNPAAIPDEEWITQTTDPRDYCIPKVGDILNQPTDDEWVSSVEEDESDLGLTPSPMETESEDGGHSPRTKRASPAAEQSRLNKRPRAK